MTDELIKRLVAAGLSKQQASSVTAETLVNLFMPHDGKMLIYEAKKQVDEMKGMVLQLQKEYYNLQQKIEKISETILAVVEAQQKCGEVSEEKARNALALYAAILSMNQRAGASGVDAVKNAGYVMYAYLGGQAKREIAYYNGSEND